MGPDDGPGRAVIVVVLLAPAVIRVVPVSRTAAHHHDLWAVAAGDRERC